MKPSENQLREAARAIRSRLKSIVSGTEASALDAQLVELLGQAQHGADVGVDILRLLGQRDATRKWLQVFLETGAADPIWRTYEELPGRSAPEPGKKFVCPDCDYEWYRPFKGYPVPKCPKHGKDLVKAP
jgi:hypothetical protein